MYPTYSFWNTYWNVYSFLFLGHAKLQVINVQYPYDTQVSTYITVTIQYFHHQPLQSGQMEC